MSKVQIYPTARSTNTGKPKSVVAYHMPRTAGQRLNSKLRERWTVEKIIIQKNTFVLGVPSRQALDLKEVCI